jgi:hypothetical protein
MLLVLIPIVWIALLTLFAAVCRVAAEGDAQHAPTRSRGPVSIGTKLTLSPAANGRLQQSRGRVRLGPTLTRAARVRRPAHTHRTH